MRQRLGCAPDSPETRRLLSEWGHYRETAQRAARMRSSSSSAADIAAAEREEELERRQLISMFNVIGI